MNQMRKCMQLKLIEDALSKKLDVNNLEPIFQCIRTSFWFEFFIDMSFKF